MKAAILATSAALLLAVPSSAGLYQPPPGDCCPQWSPHATQIVFATSRAGNGTSVGVVSSTTGKEQLVPGIPYGTRSPDWNHVAYVTFAGGNAHLNVANVDGSGAHVVATVFGDRDWAWSPDSTRLTYVAPGGSLGVVRADGTGRVTVDAGDTAMPAWSPDAKRIAYVTAGRLKVVDATGGNGLDVARGTFREPQWSPDAMRLSVVDGTSLRVIRIGGPSKAYPIGTGLVNIAWLPDGSGLLYLDHLDHITRLDLASGKRRILATGAQAVLSPDGTRLAFGDGGECRDRQGVYVVRIDGTGLRRLTNDCRIVGTPGPDTLHGSFSQVVLGLAGDDTLYADDTYYFFDGDTLYGGPGNDHLIGGFGQDILNGGPGDDVITGGGSADTIVGGPGRDRIAGGGGGDTIYAKDGQRDVVDCGNNGYGKRGRDTVYADRIDVISHCEIVHRS
jgi:hypothetical protein